MGSSSSAPRTLTVENPEPAGSGPSVQVSEAALRRTLAAATSAPQYQETSPQAAPPPRPKYDYSKEEEYWTRRIEGLKRTHQSINKKMEEEYNKAVAETAQMFQRTQTSSIVGKMPPCQQEKSSILKCYTQNPTQTLLCTQIVNSFNDCVSKNRLESAATGA